MVLASDSAGKCGLTCLPLHLCLVCLQLGHNQGCLHNSEDAGGVEPYAYGLRRQVDCTDQSLLPPLHALQGGECVISWHLRSAVFWGLPSQKAYTSIGLCTNASCTHASLVVAYVCLTGEAHLSFSHNEGWLKLQHSLPLCLMLCSCY